MPTGQRPGYTRTSAADQTSGKDPVRPQLQELLRFVREGDTIVVHSMDRLARNFDDLRAPVRGA